MARNSLSPAFIKIDYHSGYGHHVMTVPTVPIEASGTASGYEFILRGAELPTDVGAAVAAFVAKLKPFVPATVAFDDYVAYTQPTPEDTPTPVLTDSLGVGGTSGAVGWSKAVQDTFTWRADDFTIFKIVLLDADSFGNFDRNTNALDGGAIQALHTYVTAPESFIASRGGGRPSAFLQESKTLNEKLRREYGMT